MFHVRSTLHPLWCMVGRVYSLTHIASDQSDRTTDPAQRSHTLRFLVFFFFFSVWFIRWLVCAPFNHYYFHWLLAGWGCWCLMHIHMMTFVYTTIYIVSAHSKGHSPIFISILFFFINAYFSGSLFISFWSAASLASLFHAQRGIGPHSRWCLPKYKAHTSMNPWKPDTRLVS